MTSTYQDKGHGPIGVFDSGYGGLTILQQIRTQMPSYDYLYLGDNARAPYGPLSFDLVYENTWQCVQALFERGCHLVILACNTASAKALRTIQQNDLPQLDPNRRVLGVIRPTVEMIGTLTESRHIGVLATQGTILSKSYELEIKKLFPDIKVEGEACPMWVPIVENKEFNSPGTDYFIKERIDDILYRDPQIDTLILGCTHYPLLFNKIRQNTPPHIKLVPQGHYVASSLQTYMQRHPELAQKCTKNGITKFLTTESANNFCESASLFLGEAIEAQRIVL
ncbi:MAG: glutamate racemase [Bacteroidaceae bacterium]